MTTSDTATHTQPFQAEVSELLHLMVHSVYSETDIFLRELVSNASDACDKLRYEAIANPALVGEGDARGARHRDCPASEGRCEKVSRSLRDRAHRRCLFRQYPVSDRAGARRG